MLSFCDCLSCSLLVWCLSLNLLLLAEQPQCSSTSAKVLRLDYHSHTPFDWGLTRLWELLACKIWHPWCWLLQHLPCCLLWSYWYFDPTSSSLGLSTSQILPFSASVLNGGQQSGQGLRVCHTGHQLYGCSNLQQCRKNVEWGSYLTPWASLRHMNKHSSTGNCRENVKAKQLELGKTLQWGLPRCGSTPDELFG